MPGPANLRDVVEVAAARHDASGRELAAIAQANGHRLAHTTVNRILQGTYSSTPSRQTLKALAWLSGLTDAEVHRAAGSPVVGGPEDHTRDAAPANLREVVELALRRHEASGRQLALMAQQAGFAITTTTVNHLRNGTYHSSPSGKTLAALAWLSGLSDETVHRAAGKPVPGPPFADELPPGVDNLPPKVRKAAIEILRVLVSEHERSLR